MTKYWNVTVYNPKARTKKERNKPFIEKKYIGSEKEAWETAKFYSEKGFVAGVSEGET